jgi:hypothetical protein
MDSTTTVDVDPSGRVVTVVVPLTVGMPGSAPQEVVPGTPWFENSVTVTELPRSSDEVWTRSGPTGCWFPPTDPGGEMVPLA